MIFLLFNLDFFISYSNLFFAKVSMYCFVVLRTVGAVCIFTGHQWTSLHNFSKTARFCPTFYSNTGDKNLWNETTKLSLGLLCIRFLCLGPNTYFILEIFTKQRTLGCTTTKYDTLMVVFNRQLSQSWGVCCLAMYGGIPADDW